MGTCRDYIPHGNIRRSHSTWENVGITFHLGTCRDHISHGNMYRSHFIREHVPITREHVGNTFHEGICKITFYVGNKLKDLCQVFALGQSGWEGCMMDLNPRSLFVCHMPLSSAQAAHRQDTSFPGKARPE